MNIQFGLLETKLTTEDQKCQAKDCFREIKTDESCFVDVSTSAVLCDDCGKCERYSRKKEEERGGKDAPLIKGLDY